MKKLKKNPSRKLLILDIDSTILYLYDGNGPKIKNPDFIYEHVYNNNVKYYPIVKRPFLDQFLLEVNKKYDLALWTTGNENYASEINKLIFEPLGIKLKFIWSQQHCEMGTGKNLEFVTWEFPEYKKENIIAIDDSKNCYVMDPNNLILISKFLGDSNDKELMRVFDLLIRAL